MSILRRADARICLGLFVLAAFVRVLFLRGTVDRDLPFSIFYYGDSRVYREFALAILRGESFDLGIPYHPPAFAYLLAGMIRVVGENPGAIRAALAVLAAATVPLTFLLGTLLWGRAVGLVAAFLATFSFGLCVTSVSPNVEAIYVPILAAQALAMVLLVRSASCPPGRGAVGLALLNGILVGLGSLTRAEHLGFAAIVPLVLWIGATGLPWRRLSRLSLLVLAASALSVAPWTVANWRALDRYRAEHPDGARLSRFVLVSSYGALNFALANHAGADGTFRPDALVRGMGSGRLDLRDPRQAEIYLHGYREGLSFLLGHPVASVRLAYRKIALSSGGLALGFGAGNRPSGLAGVRRPVDLFVPDRRWFGLVTLLLVAAGAWTSRRRWREVLPVGMVLAHKLATCVAFFGYARLQAHVAPFLFLLAAAAVVGFVRAIPSAAVIRGLAGAGIFVMALLVAELGGRAAAPRNFSASGSADPVNGKIIQDAEVRIEPTP